MSPMYLLSHLIICKQKSENKYFISAFMHYVQSAQKIQFFLEYMSVSKKKTLSYNLSELKVKERGIK